MEKEYDIKNLNPRKNIYIHPEGLGALSRKETNEELMKSHKDEDSEKIRTE